MTTIKGRVVSATVEENRSNLVVVSVSANEYGGKFTCPVSAVTLDGRHITHASEVTVFEEEHHVYATVRDIDQSSDVGGVRRCAGIDIVSATE